MSYRIDYAQTDKTVPPGTLHPVRIFLLTMTVLFLFLTAVHKYFPEGWVTLQEILLPGDAAVTQQALNLFADNLRAGIPFSDAAQAFCEEIIAHADIP